MYVAGTHERDPSPAITQQVNTHNCCAYRYSLQGETMNIVVTTVSLVRRADPRPCLRARARGVLSGFNINEGTAQQFAADARLVLLPVRFCINSSCFFFHCFGLVSTNHDPFCNPTPTLTLTVKPIPTNPRLPQINPSAACYCFVCNGGLQQAKM